jgi:hypothetical protein
MTFVIRPSMATKDVEFKRYAELLHHHGYPDWECVPVSLPGGTVSLEVRQTRISTREVAGKIAEILTAETPLSWMVHEVTETTPAE